MKKFSIMTKKERKIFMKKFKKVMAMSLAAMAVVSAMSMTASAEDLTNSAQCVKGGMAINPNTPEIGTVITYTNDEGIEKTAVIDEIVELVPVNPGISLAWSSRTYEGVAIPKNITGNEGVQLGPTYTASLTDNYAYVTTSNWNAYLNKLNIALIDETEGNVKWGYASAEGTYYINYRLIAGNKYSYKFSAEQSGNQQCTADIQMWSN